MLPIFLLALLGHVVSVPLTSQDAEPRTEELSARYLLPQEVKPTLYDVELELDPDNHDYFIGNVSIRVIAFTDSTVITLHAMEMTIHRISVFDSANNDIFLNFTTASDDTHLLNIQLTEALRTFTFYTIEIDYVGTYAENMFGIYVSTYEHEGQTANLITSQLQPTFARRAFPCFDEPALKAFFRTTIYAPPTYPVVRSNTPVKAQPTKNDRPGLVTHEFEDTLIMSTYLLAYLVSNFEYIDNSENKIYDKPFRVYSRPGTRQFAEFALDFGQKNLIELENYTQMAYAFPKMDKAAVPDFAAGAMENWGLVIYREVALLVRAGVTTTATKQNIGRIICHENTHMWFGNEVGPDSWTYTWLNEGFANFFENYGTDLVLPGWRMMDQFVLLLQNVFQSDAVLSVNPMTHPVYTPSQILGTFNAVAYQKSGSVIRMMKHFLTPEVFRQGLAIYLKNRSRQAATPTHLYQGLQQALAASNHEIPYSLTTIMSRWTTQGGFPVLTVRKSAPLANSISIEQERFLTDNTLSSNDRWHVPVNWVISSSPNFEDTSPQGWVPPSFPAVSFNIPELASADWFIINKQQTGYYRVNYEPSNWAALAKVLQSEHNIIHVLNRAQLIDDSFNMARNSRLAYEYAFELSRYLEKEEDYIPWASANSAFSYLDIVLSGSGETYQLFQKYVLDLTASTYERLGFKDAPSDEHVTAFHRNIILDLNCRYGLEDCVGTAQGLLEQFRLNAAGNIDNESFIWQDFSSEVSSLSRGDSQNIVDNKPDADLQTTVYCSGLRGGDAENFHFLWNLYEATTDSSEQSILLNALGCTSNETLRSFYLNQVISTDSIVREQDRHTIVVATTNASPESMEAALDFVIENFAEIQPRVQGLTGTTNILNAFARRLTTEDHLRKIEEFESRHGAIFTAGEVAAIAAIRENIAASITWSNNNFAAVNAWLQQNNGSSIITGSFILLISIIATIFNS